MTLWEIPADRAYGCAYRLVSKSHRLLQFAAREICPICRPFQLHKTRFSLFSWTLNPKVEGSNPSRPTSKPCKIASSVGSWTGETYVCAYAHPFGSASPRSSSRPLAVRCSLAEGIRAPTERAARSRVKPQARAPEESRCRRIARTGRGSSSWQPARGRCVAVDQVSDHRAERKLRRDLTPQRVSGRIA